MDKKGLSKKYLISVSALYFIGAAVLFIIAVAVSKSAAYTGDYTVIQLLLLSLCLSLIPAGTYTGAVILGTKINEITKVKAVILIVFFPLILLFSMVLGIVMLILTVIRSLYNLRG